LWISSRTLNWVEYLSENEWKKGEEMGEWGEVR
jgi:hypothetical protein